MASPTDKSFKVITATIQSILKWKQYRDKVALLYEIFGKNVSFLFSQNSLSPALSLIAPLLSSFLSPLWVNWFLVSDDPCFDILYWFKNVFANLIADHWIMQFMSFHWCSHHCIRAIVSCSTKYGKRKHTHIFGGSYFNS